MWGWLKAIFSALIEAIFGEVRKELEKPKTIESANTPKRDADRFADGFRDWLRRKKSGGD
jgi:hypothetical protein